MREEKIGSAFVIIRFILFFATLESDPPLACRQAGSQARGLWSIVSPILDPRHTAPSTSSLSPILKNCIPSSLLTHLLTRTTHTSAPLPSTPTPLFSLLSKPTPRAPTPKSRINLTNPEINNIAHRTSHISTPSLLHARELKHPKASSDSQEQNREREKQKTETKHWQSGNGTGVEMTMGKVFIRV